MATEHQRHVSGLTTTARVSPGAIWLCRACHRTNARGWQVCRLCGAERPARRAWMKTRAFRSIVFLLTAVGSGALGVVVLSAWGAVISGPWVLPAIALWVLGCLATLVAAWMRRALSRD